MIINIGNEMLCPGAYVVVKGFSDRLVGKEEGDTAGVEGGDSVTVNDCEGVYDGEEMGLNLKIILRDVDRNENVCFVCGKNFLK